MQFGIIQKLHLLFAMCVCRAAKIVSLLQTEQIMDCWIVIFHWILCIFFLNLAYFHHRIIVCIYHSGVRMYECIFIFWLLNKRPHVYIIYNTQRYMYMSGHCTKVDIIYPFTTRSAYEMQWTKMYAANSVQKTNIFFIVIHVYVYYVMLLCITFLYIIHKCIQNVLYKCNNIAFTLYKIFCNKLSLLI